MTEKIFTTPAAEIRVSQGGTVTFHSTLGDNKFFVFSPPELGAVSLAIEQAQINARQEQIRKAKVS